MVILTSNHKTIGFRISTVHTANKDKGNESPFPFSLFDFQVHRTLQSDAIERSCIAHS